MEREAFRTLLRPLVNLYRLTFDAADWVLHYEALRDIPEALLREAITRVARTGREFFPRAAELRALAEDVRIEQLAQHPWTPCEDCTNGWRPITDDRGVQRLTRCDCRERHIVALDAIGIPRQSLTGATGEVLERAPAPQGPAALSPAMTAALQQLQGIAAAKTMPRSTSGRQTDLDGAPL